MQRLQETLCSRGLEIKLVSRSLLTFNKPCARLQGKGKKMKEKKIRHTIFELTSCHRLTQRARVRQSIGKPQPLQEGISSKGHRCSCHPQTHISHDKCSWPAWRFIVKISFSLLRTDFESMRRSGVSKKQGRQGGRRGEPK